MLLMMMDTASVMLHLSSASGRILQWSPGIHPVRAAEIGFYDEEEPVPAVRRHFGISRRKEEPGPGSPYGGSSSGRR